MEMEIYPEFSANFSQGCCFGQHPCPWGLLGLSPFHVLLPPPFSPLAVFLDLICLLLMQKFLSPNESTGYWIGLRKQYPKGIHKWQDGSAPTFVWVSLLGLRTPELVCPIVSWRHLPTDSQTASSVWFWPKPTWLSHFLLSCLTLWSHLLHSLGLSISLPQLCDKRLIFLNTVLHLIFLLLLLLSHPSRTHFIGLVSYNMCVKPLRGIHPLPRMN